MVDKPSHNADKAPSERRDSAKCSQCRKQKIKCKPHDRDWDNKQQRCDRCEDKGLDCGPNFTNKEDPGVVRQGRGNSVVGSSPQRSAPDPSSRRSRSPRNTVTSALRSRTAHGQRRRTRSTEGGGGKGKDPIKHIGALSGHQLTEEALSKLNDFNALVTILISASHLPPVPCGHPRDPQGYLSTVKDHLHCLFIYIFRLGTQANQRAQHDQVRWILSELVRALDKHPTLYDDRKQDALLEMAVIFQNLKLPWGSEHILWKICCANDTAMPELLQKACHLLAESLWSTSETIRQLFEKIWQMTSVFEKPLNMDVPPLQRAAQNPNPGVVTTVLSQAHRTGSPPTLYTEQITDDMTALEQREWDRMRTVTDTRDCLGRTSLYLAAADGHEHCCFALLRANADPDSRDSHKHTVLEVAARGGHLRVVTQLLTAGTEVNPQMAGCASSPLQAAIESDNFQFDLVDFLLKRGADVEVRRLCDDKNAIDLAQEKGLLDLARHMQEHYSNPHDHFPLHHQSAGQASAEGG